MHKNDSVLKATGALPLWKCHKVVGGSKIVDAQVLPGGGGVLVLECGFSATVDKHYVEKHSPMAGGYFVVYEDGYESFSPADAFNNGYSRIADSADVGGSKDLAISDSHEARKNISDLKIFGNGDTFSLLCKASSEKQGWMKSTKVCNVNGGCIVQVTTQQRNPDGSYAVAEALTYVPGVSMDKCPGFDPVLRGWRE